MERSTTARDLDVDLTCVLALHADRLEVRYRIDNRRKDAAAVLDRIPSQDIDGAVEYDRDDVYVDLQGEVLRLTKGALLVREVFPGVYDYPDARLVASGASLADTFVVPIPVKVRIPYKKLGRGETIAAKKAVAREVGVAVGVVPADAGCELSRNHPAYPDAVSVRGEVFEPGGGLLLLGQTMLSVRFELGEELPVLDYESFPWP
jgi:hypothetical protein